MKSKTYIFLNLFLFCLYVLVCTGAEMPENPQPLAKLMSATAKVEDFGEVLSKCTTEEKKQHYAFVEFMGYSDQRFDFGDSELQQLDDEGKVFPIEEQFQAYQGVVAYNVQEKLIKAIKNFDGSESSAHKATIERYGVLAKKVEKHYLTENVSLINIALESKKENSVKLLLQLNPAHAQSIEKGSFWTPEAFLAHSDPSLVVLKLIANNNKTIVEKMAQQNDSIFNAINKKEISLVAYLMEQGADINVHHESGKRTPLIHALNSGDQATALALLKHGIIGQKINVNLCDSCNNTALHVAIQKGYVDVVRELCLVRNALVSTINGSGDTPLLAAIHATTNIEIVQIVCSVAVKYSENIEINMLNRAGETPLHKAIAKIQNTKTKIETVKLLLSCLGVDVNKKDQQGWSPLLKAVYSGPVEIVELLVAREDLEVNILDNRQQTALDNIAYLFGDTQTRIQQLLRDKGAKTGKELVAATSSHDDKDQRILPVAVNPAKEKEQSTSSSESLQVTPQNNNRYYLFGGLTFVALFVVLAMYHYKNSTV